MNETTTKNPTQVNVSTDLTEQSMNRLQKNIMETLYLLGGEYLGNTFSYSGNHSEFITYIDGILGSHSDTTGNTIYVKDNTEVPALMNNFVEAQQTVKKQVEDFYDSDSYAIDRPLELDLFEQSLLVSEVGYIRDTGTKEYIMLDVSNITMDAMDTISLFYSFVPMVVDKDTVCLCDTQKFRESVENKPMPVLHKLLQQDVAVLEDLPFGSTECSICGETHKYIDAHEVYAHNTTKSLAKPEKEVLKGVLISDKGELVRTVDGWSIEVTDIPIEFGEWLENVLSSSKKVIIEESEDNMCDLFVYPSSSFNTLVRWLNREENMYYSKDLLTILFALEGECYQREVYFDLDISDSNCAELFELLVSFRIEEDECVVSQKELETVIDHRPIDGFEDKWD